jgi:hypothetical protein
MLMTLFVSSIFGSIIFYKLKPNEVHKYLPMLGKHYPIRINYGTSLHYDCDSIDTHNAYKDGKKIKLETPHIQTFN